MSRDATHVLNVAVGRGIERYRFRRSWTGRWVLQKYDRVAARNPHLSTTPWLDADLGGVLDFLHGLEPGARLSALNEEA